MRLLCWFIGHRWFNHNGIRIQSDWYVGSMAGSGLHCGRCGRVR